MAEDGPTEQSDEQLATVVETEAETASPAPDTQEPQAEVPTETGIYHCYNVLNHAWSCVLKVLLIMGDNICLLYLKSK